jgi:orotidine-5'-phosphate decarboxylase
VKKPKIVGVTILTSLDGEIMNTELKINENLRNMVLHLAKLSEKSGLDGIVCSALELPYIKNYLRKDFIYVTPGIVVDSREYEGQKRVCTAKEAVLYGSSILVFGRSLIESKMRKKLIYRTIKDIASVL